VEHKIKPTIEFPLGSPSFTPTKAIILITNPITAKGMLIQFNDPKHGKKAIIMPAIDKIPNTKLATCIELNSYLIYVKIKKNFDKVDSFFNFIHKKNGI
jgi:hypothetical protein